jgi:hypothetical protein
MGNDLAAAWSGSGVVIVHRAMIATDRTTDDSGTVRKGAHVTSMQSRMVAFPVGIFAN